MAGGTDHKAAPDGIADFSQVVQAPHPIFKTHFGGVQSGIMPLVGGFVAQKIAVGTRPEKREIAFIAPLAEREGNGTIGKFGLYTPDDPAEPLVGKPGVLSPLQHKGAKTEGIALTRAGKDLLACQTVALGFFVAPAQAAIKAVVFAIAADLDQSAHENLVAVSGGAYLVCLFCKQFGKFGSSTLDQFPILRKRKPVRFP